MMQTPGFWYRKRGLLAHLLRPLGWLYARGTAVRLARGARFDPGIPVLCVGNLNAGGTGKTPVAIAIAERLIQRGRSPAFLSRGYGGRLVGPHKVDERADRAEDVGDEPLLLAAFAPTWISKDRAAGARAVSASGADVIIMDDGFQNAALDLGFSVVVVDASRGFGNGLCIPAGPLREPVSTGLARADALLAIGETATRAEFQGSINLPMPFEQIGAELCPLQTGMDWSGLRVVAFAGIGHPEKFFATLRAQGAEIVETHALADHQALDKKLINRLLARAANAGARLVTTEKDAVRLPQSLRTEVLTLPVRLQVDDWTAVDAAFDRLGL